MITGGWMLPTLEGALARIAELEKRIAKLEKILLGSSAVSIKSPISADSPLIGDNTEAPLPHLDQATPTRGKASSVRIKSAIETEFPGIAEKLVLLWGHPECLTYLSKLIIDSRGNRKGFNLDVMGELIMLVEITGQTDPQAWAEFIKLGNR